MSATVGHLMAAHPIVVRAGESVRMARDRMVEHGIHALPVVEGRGTPVGILTSFDLLEDIEPERAVGEVMTPVVHTIEPTADARLAAHTMRNHRLHHLVVTDRGRLVGILSSLDLLHLVEQPPPPEGSET